MVPGVGIESLDAVLAVVHQADGQVLVGQSDVVGEVVNPRDAADELPAGGVVVPSLVHQDPVELDGQPLPGVALGHGHGEGRPGSVGPAAAGAGQPRVPLAPLGPFLPRGPVFPGIALQTLGSPGPCLADGSCFPLRARLARVSCSALGTWKTNDLINFPDHF